jgi:hypothetical protein
MNTNKIRPTSKANSNLALRLRVLSACTFIFMMYQPRTLILDMASIRYKNLIKIFRVVRKFCVGACVNGPCLWNDQMHRVPTYVA